ncbi:MAG: hypothetical protein NTZ74_07420 [Chloroflexi bacterium]|nr:hypothetical protein [Chloroflexota bacterium]
MRRMFMICCMILPLIILSSCGSNNSQAITGAKVQTPTISFIFKEDFAPIPNSTPSVGNTVTPTESYLFAGIQSTPLVAPVSGPQVPTIAGIFSSTVSASTATPEVTNPGTGITPTLAHFFEPATPVVLEGGNNQSAPTTVVVTQPVVNPDQMIQTPIFSDSLDPNWSMDQSWGIKRSLDNSAFTYLGNNSIRVQATEDFGSLFFTIQKNTSRSYLRAKLAGISLWVNPGDNTIRPDQLAVSVIGSNDNNYWVQGDTSVIFIGKNQFFSETKLYYLNVNRSLPANSWTQIIVWLDKLVYDPEYKYLSGFYIKTDKGFQSPFYVADVALYEIK